MLQRTTFIAIASGFMFLGMDAPASAQTALSSCNPATGLTPSGQECVTLTQIDPTRYQTQISGEGASNYSAVNVGELANTYQCDPSRGTGAGSGPGTLLIEDCGEPLSLDPSTFKEFVGYSGGLPAPTPAPVAPVVPAPVAPVVPAPVAPVIPPVAAVAPVPLAAAGLGNAGLIAAGLGAAALIGIVAVALDDDDSTVSTTRRP